MPRFAAVFAIIAIAAAGLSPAVAQTPASPAPAAAATAPSPVAAALSAAMEKVTSFRLIVTTPTGMVNTMTYVGPKQRMKMLMTMGPMVVEGVTADGLTYVRVNGGEWRRQEMPAGGESGTPLSLIKRIANAQSIRPLPDRTENGIVVGVYEVAAPAMPGASPSAPLQPLTCTYDKTSSLPRACENAMLTMKYEGWNDPANVVDVPVIASPAPAASPHP